MAMKKADKPMLSKAIVDTLNLMGCNNSNTYDNFSTIVRHEIKKMVDEGLLSTVPEDKRHTRKFCLSKDVSATNEDVNTIINPRLFRIWKESW